MTQPAPYLFTMPTAQTLTGSIHALARWFENPRDVSGNADDFEREELLRDVYAADRVACRGDEVLVRTPLGACIITRTVEQGCALVWFDHVSNGRWARRSFWYNAHSVKGLGERLRALQAEQREQGITPTFDALFVGADC